MAVNTITDGVNEDLRDGFAILHDCLNAHDITLEPEILEKLVDILENTPITSNPNYGVLLQQANIREIKEIKDRTTILNIVQAMIQAHKEISGLEYEFLHLQKGKYEIIKDRIAHIHTLSGDIVIDFGYVAVGLQEKVHQQITKTVSDGGMPKQSPGSIPWHTTLKVNSPNAEFLIFFPFGEKIDHTHRIKPIPQSSKKPPVYMN